MNLTTRTLSPTQNRVAQRLCSLMLLQSIACLLLPTRVTGQEFFECYGDWPEQTTIRGTLIVVPILATLEEQAGTIRELLDGRPVAIARAGDVAVPDEVRRLAGLLSEQVTEVGLHETADAADSLGAGCLLLHDDSIAAEFDAAAREQCIVRLREHLNRSGSLIVVGELAESVGTWSLEGLQPPPSADTTDGSASFAAGLGLLPDGLLQIIDDSAAGEDSEVAVDGDAAEYSDTTRAATSDKLPRLVHHPQSVGVQLTRDSLLVLSGRLLKVLGPGYARLSLAEAPSQTSQSQLLRERERRRSTTQWLADWTQGRRRALELQLEPFPPTERQTPSVPNGTLLIVGGGGLPDGLMDRFIELAGGAENARLVYVPCAEEDDVPPGGILRQWRALGVVQVAQIHTKDRRKANEDETLLEPLRQATGIWFGGGRQWNFADSYYGSQAHRLMKEVLARGGVIGGSSAGASIQASYLARATPIGNTEIIAPGYERGGLGFITGVAIDQHFSQRNRHADLKQLVTQYPQLLGIGIDETTAIEVSGSEATVTGTGQVFFDQWLAGESGGSVEVTAVSAGQSFDLAERAVMEQAVR